MNVDWNTLIALALAAGFAVGVLVPALCDTHVWLQWLGALAIEAVLVAAALVLISNMNGLRVDEFQTHSNQVLTICIGSALATTVGVIFLTMIEELKRPF